VSKDMLRRVEEAAGHLRGVLPELPDIVLVLGSGLGHLADRIERPTIVPYKEIPHFPVSTVSGHAGEIVSGKLRGRNVIAMKGRIHLYEGYDAQTVAFPIRVMRELGAKRLLITNASGGINPSFRAGDLMLIRDQINFMFRNPLIGPNADQFGERFPDMSEPYDKRLRGLALRVAAGKGIVLREGVYAGVLGPSYETPAEIRMLRTLGADAVGMSTVPEVIAARHAGMNVLGISCITNMAAGILGRPLSHAEVTETAGKVRHTFSELLLGIIPEM